MTDTDRRAASHAAHQLAGSLLERAPFASRGFSERTIKAVVGCGIDAPERLLFMTSVQIASIPGLGKSSVAEVAKYRSRFLRSE